MQIASILIAATLLVASSAHAQPAQPKKLHAEMAAQQIEITTKQLDQQFYLCRMTNPMLGADSAKTCIDGGKVLVKTLMPDVGSLLGGEAANEFLEWRLEWTMAFEATDVRDGTHGFQSRVNEAAMRVKRARAKLLIAIGQ